MSTNSRQFFPHSVQGANGRITNIEGGIQLREYMAMEFMKAIIQSTAGGDLPEETQAAKDAVLYADAVIAELAENR